MLKIYRRSLFKNKSDLKKKEVGPIPLVLAMLFLSSCASTNRYKHIIRNGTTYDAVGATVNIDGSIEYQTIEGWGVTQHVYADWSKDWPRPYPIPYQDVANQIKSLGFDYAFVLHGPLENINDDNDPFHYNWSSYNAQFSQHDLYFRRCKHLQNAGLKLVLSEYNYNKMLWATDQSFPDKGGNHIRSSDPNIYNEVAEYWTALFHYAKDNYNLTFDYISIQNEPNPDGEFTYWSPSELAEGIKALGSRLRQEGFTTKIIAPDDATAISSKEYLWTILQNPIAKSYIDHIAFHAYDGGYPSGTADDAIMGIINLAQDPLVINSGLSLWMTEWAHGATQMEKALEYAKLIYNCHVYGNAANYFVWASTAYPDGFFTNNIIIGKIDLLKYGHALTQYSKYVRPGAKRIDARLSGADNVYVTAYKHDADGQFTIEFINKGTTGVTVEVKINNIHGLSVLNIIQTSAIENSANLGQVSLVGNSFNYTLPAESITTFFKSTIGQWQNPAINPLGKPYFLLAHRP